MASEREQRLNCTETYFEIYIYLFSCCCNFVIYFVLSSQSKLNVGVASFFSLFTHNFHSVQSSSGASSQSAVHDEL